jgi:hypothetical protein
MNDYEKETIDFEKTAGLQNAQDERPESAAV